MAEGPAIPFARTLRALEAERRPGTAAAMLLAAVLLAGWLAWLLSAPVSLVEAGEGGRLEPAAGTLAIRAPAGGRVAGNGLRLGRRVRRGELLAAIEPAPAVVAEWQQEQARAASLASQAAALARQLAAAAGGDRDRRHENQAAAAEAAAGHREAASAAALAAERAAQAERLADLGIVPRAAAAQARAEADQRRQATVAAAAAAWRRDWQGRGDRGERTAAAAELERRLAALQGDQAAAVARAGRWQAELDRLLVRAPCDGELAAVSQLAPGGGVAAGESLALLVPAGPLKLVTRLAATALGRVRPGQSARYWLRGCPPAACGPLPAVVAAVAGEPDGGRLRVELTPLPDALSGPVHLRHGLAIAGVEIDVGRVTPIELLRRVLAASNRSGAAVSAIPSSRADRAPTPGSGPA
jgi:hemolysin D